MLSQIFTIFLNMSITASFVIIAILLIRSMMYHLPKKYRYFLWIIVGIRLICPIAISSPISLFNVIRADITNNLNIKVTKINESNNFTNDFIDEKSSNHQLINNELTTISNNHSAPFIQSKKEKTANTAIKKESFNQLSIFGNTPFTNIQINYQNPIIKYAAIFWLIGIALILCWNFYIIFSMKKYLKKAVRYKDNIYECENIPSPFVMGLFHPRIYIPFQLNAEEQQYILKHELYHIKRKDYIIKPIAFLLVCIYWFHPLVWLSYFLMIQDMEMSCDEYVLQNATVDIRKNYSKSLLGFAINQRRITANLLTFGETDTRKRVKNILNFKKHGKWIGILAIIFIAIVGISCLTNAKDTNTKTVKKENKEENQNKNREAIITTSEIHGYQTELVYISKNELPNKNDLEFGMYEGAFEIRTYRDQILYAKYPLIFDFKDTLFYPQKGFKLIVKDYDGDGNLDDFALGQGQMSMPSLGNFMSYQFYTVNEDGSIERYQFSEDKKYLVTVPDDYSKDFKCKNGQITYQALGEDGVKKQTVNIVRLISVNAIKQNIQPLQDLIAAIETIMPESIKKEIKKQGYWHLTYGNYSLGNAESNNDITMRLDFSYDGTRLVQYVSKEYGFVDKLPDDRINKDQAKDLIIAFESAFLGRKINKNNIKSYQGYNGYIGEKDYAAFIDDHKDTFLVQLSKNMIIKYDTNRKYVKATIDRK